MSGDLDSTRASGSATTDTPSPTVRPRRPAGRVARAPAWVVRWYPGSLLERLWRRLDSMDFMNRGMLFAAVLLLCLVPFMIVVQALAGQSATTRMVARFGLSDAAARDISQVFTSPSATSSSITGLSWVFFVLGGIAAAAAIQELYQHAFEVEGRGMRDLPRRLVWLACLVAAGALVGAAQPWLRDVGGPVLRGVAVLIGATGFWWFSMWLLLAGKRAWSELLPSALATGVCWLGMDIAFRLVMSNMITTDYRKYGAIGVVFAIMSFLIAVGVVIILGAVVGVVWRERKPRRVSHPSG